MILAILERYISDRISLRVLELSEEVVKSGTEGITGNRNQTLEILGSNYMSHIQHLWRFCMDMEDVNVVKSEYMLFSWTRINGFLSFYDKRGSAPGTLQNHAFSFEATLEHVGDT